MVLPPPSEPPLGLLYEEAPPLETFDLASTKDVDLVKRIHELTARNVKCMIEHRGLSQYVTTQSDAYKRFYQEFTHE